MTGLRESGKNEKKRTTEEMPNEGKRFESRY